MMFDRFCRKENWWSGVVNIFSGKPKKNIHYVAPQHFLLAANLNRSHSDAVFFSTI
jgi:hypothetical protein